MLLGRMAVTAGLVVAAALTAERVGLALGAVVATLPMSVGPAYVFLALDHGPDFVARSAVASMLGNAAAAAFVVAYAAAARRAGTALSLAAALAAWVATVQALGLVAWSVSGALAATLAIDLLGIALTRSARADQVAMRTETKAWHLLARAGGVMVLVGAVTLAGRFIGPQAAGTLALVPVIFISLCVILQPHVGGRPVAGLLAHGLVGLLSYGPAFAAMALVAERWGSWPALAGALAICLGWSAFLVALRTRRP